MFYDNFIKLCAARDVSKAEVGRAIGVSSAAISKWKDGGMPTDVTLAKLAAYFNVTTDFLLAAGPFKYWDYLNSNRGDVVNSYRIMGGTTPDGDPNDWELIDYINFVSNNVESVNFHVPGSAAIYWKHHPGTELSPQTDTSSDTIEPAAVELGSKLLAAYGDTPPNLTEAGMRDVAKYLRFVAEQEKLKDEDK